MYLLKQKGKELSRHPDANGCLLEVIRREQNPGYTVAQMQRDGYSIESLTYAQMQAGAAQADAFFDSLDKSKQSVNSDVVK